VIPAQPITFFNTGIPVMLLALAAWVLPVMLGRGAGDQQALIKGIMASALVILAGGALIFAGLYSASGVPAFSSFADRPMAVSGYFARLSLIAGIIWGPVLALAWFVLAQGVERRKGEDRARRGSV
jgi:hypothetical protein